MNVLVTGGYGQLGTAIRRRWTGVNVVAPEHAALDIEDEEQVESAIECARPDVVVNCAAFHDVDRCEVEPRRAFAVNAAAVAALAAHCRNHRATLVTISTDYVFDGNAGAPYTEDASTHPLNIYGASKLAGEIAVALSAGTAYVVRTCGLYGAADRINKPSFVARIIAQAASGEAVAVSGDFSASPTYAGHLADALLELIRARAEPGLYHMANAGPVTWFDFAAEALTLAGLPLPRIRRSTPGAGARRPLHSALASVKLARLGITLPDWRAGLAAYFTEGR